MDDKLQLQPGEVIALCGEGWYIIIFIEKQTARIHVDKDVFEMREEGKHRWFTRKRDQCLFLLHANYLLEVTKVVPPSTETIAAAELAGEEYPGDFLMLKSTIDKDEFLFNKETLYKIEKVPCGGEEHCPQCRANAQHKRDEAKKAAEEVAKVEVIVEEVKTAPTKTNEPLEPGEVKKPKAPKKTTRVKAVKKTTVNVDEELEEGEIPKASKKKPGVKKTAVIDDVEEPGEVKKPKAPKKTTRTKAVKKTEDDFEEPLEPGEIRKPKAPKKTTRAKAVKKTTVNVEEELEEGEIPKASKKKPGVKKTAVIDDVD